MVVRAIFCENNKYYSQVFSDELFDGLYII